MPSDRTPDTAAPRMPAAVARIWGDDAVWHPDCAAWHHRRYHGRPTVRLPLGLRLRFAVRAFRRELRTHA